VTLRRVGDPVEAQMLVDLLREEGIVAITPGNEHNAMMGGLLAGALDVPLKVPPEDAERARAILSALEEYDEVDPEDAAPSAREAAGGGPYRGASEPEGPTPRKKTVAVAAALIMPGVIGAFGSGHFYVRSWARGFALLAIAWLCAILGMSGQAWAWLGLPLVVAYDIFGALSVISRDARG